MTQVDQRMLFQMFGNRERVGKMPVHAHAKRLDALEEQERIERAHARAQVAQPFHAAADDERQVAPKTSLKFMP